jgi:hypothetical protein
MIERRAEERVRVEVCVRLVGKDAHCESFSESVLATNLSRSGALLTRVKAQLRCGDLITVEYGSHTAQFRIVWVLDGSAREGIRVAIHKLENQDCPWEAVLPLEEAVGR